MKRSIGTAALVIALTGFATLADAQTGSNPPHYAVAYLPTLGGLSSNGYGGVTNTGWVSGDSSLSGDTTEHAFVWRDGVITDLRTLGGLNSSTPWAQKNNIGLIVGQAQGSRPDPLGEYWGVAYVCLNANPCMGWQNLQFGFVWQKGVMTPLPTLGGNNSTATAANNLGQVVGWDETRKTDSNCVLPQQLEIKAVVYQPVVKPNERVFYKPYALPTFPGDDLAAAFGINDNGDVVGMSGTCGTPDSYTLGVHAVLWRYGSVFDLASLGGKTNNAATVINNAGEIVGQSDLPGDVNSTRQCADVPGTRAVLWQNGKIINLGTLPGDCLSSASDINSQGQVVGVSCDDSYNCRAFLWDHGVMMDLNRLITSGSPTGSSLYLTGASGINDFGWIAGTAVDLSNQSFTPAFLAKPTPIGQVVADPAPKISLAENVRASLQRRLRLRHFGDYATAQQ
jgi:probable HAF family extracellular repeat protein